MRIEQLIYFTDIAHTGSISTTAQRVFLSQQAISESIRSLERELGCDLLNRSKTGVTLTSKGQIVVEYAQELVMQYHNMLTALANTDTPSDITGKIMLSTSPMVNASIMPEVQRKLQKKYPSFILHSETVTNDMVIKHVNNHTADLGFCYYTSMELAQLEQYRTQYPGLELRKLYTTPIVYCVRKDSTLFSQKDEPDNLQVPSKTLVIYFSSDYTKAEKQFHHQLNEKPIQYDSFLVSDDISLIRDLILRYDAICAMPELTYRLFFNYRDYHAIPFSKTVSDDLYCVYNKDCYHSQFDIVITAVEQEIRHILQKKLEY